MPKDIKNLSGNTLSELQSLTNAISKIIDRDYSHVKDELPDSLINFLKVYSNMLETERVRRLSSAKN